MYLASMILNVQSKFEFLGKPLKTDTVDTYRLQPGKNTFFFAKVLQIIETGLTIVEFVFTGIPTHDF